MRATRKAPFNIRQKDLRTLHAVAMKLMRQERTKDLSDRQEWLLGQIFHELRWRHERYRQAGLLRPCCCQLCLPPWPAGSDTPVEPQGPHGAPRELEELVDDS